MLRKKAHLQLFELILCAMFGSLTFAMKMAMASLPNIEPVTLLLMLCTLLFGAKAFLTTAVYVVLEGLFFGFTTYWLGYVYAWPILVLITLALRRFRSPILFTVVAGLYGFLFGFLFLPVNYFVYGMQGRPDMVITYILNDIPFDLMHAIGNVVIVFFLLTPLRQVLEKAIGYVRKENKL